MKRLTFFTIFALIACLLLFTRAVPTLGDSATAPATITRTPTLTRTPTATRYVTATATITRTPKPTLTQVSAADKKSTSAAATQHVADTISSSGLAPISSANLRALADLGVEAGSPADFNSTLKNVVFSPDGKLLASVVNNTIQVWDVAYGRVNSTLSGHTDIVNSVAFSPDGKLLASSSQDKTIRLWDVGAGNEQSRLFTRTAPATAVVFSPDGAFLASCNGADGVLLWGIADGQVKGKIASSGLCRISNLAFSPDSKLLALGDCATYKAVPTPVKTTGATPQPVCSKGRIHLWDIGSGMEDLYLDGGTDSVRSLAFNPAGTLLAAGSCATGGLSPQGDAYCLVGEIRVWDVLSGKLRATLAGGADYVRSLAFSPDATLLASSSCAKMSKAADGHYACMTASGYQIQLWAMPSGQLLTSMPAGETDPANALVFSPDGTRLAAVAGSSKSPRIWAAVKPGVEDNRDNSWYPPEWAVSYVRPLRYSINVGDAQMVQIGSCPYTEGYTLVLRVVQVTVTITDVKTNKQISAQTFTGRSPGSCPYQEAFYSKVQYQDGEQPEIAPMQSWIKNTLTGWGVK